MFEVSGLDLMNIANKNISDNNKKIKSKFSIIIAVAKRARQLISSHDVRVENNNALTVAVNDFQNEKFTIIDE